MKKALPWIVGYAVYAVVLLLVFFTLVGPVLNMGSGVFHYCWPLLIAGLLFVLTRKPVADLWA